MRCNASWLIFFVGKKLSNFSLFFTMDEITQCHQHQMHCFMLLSPSSTAVSIRVIPNARWSSASISTHYSFHWFCCSFLLFCLPLPLFLTDPSISVWVVLPFAFFFLSVGFSTTLICLPSIISISCFELPYNHCFWSRVVPLSSLIITSLHSSSFLSCTLRWIAHNIIEVEGTFPARTTDHLICCSIAHSFPHQHYHHLTSKTNLNSCPSARRLCFSHFIVPTSWMNWKCTALPNDVFWWKEVSISNSIFPFIIIFLPLWQRTSSLFIQPVLLSINQLWCCKDCFVCPTLQWSCDLVRQVIYRWQRLLWQYLWAIHAHRQTVRQTLPVFSFSFSAFAFPLFYITIFQLQSPHLTPTTHRKVCQK